MRFCWWCGRGWSAGLHRWWWGGYGDVSGPTPPLYAPSMARTSLKHIRTQPRRWITHSQTNTAETYTTNARHWNKQQTNINTTCSAEVSWRSVLCCACTFYWPLNLLSLIFTSSFLYSMIKRVCCWSLGEMDDYWFLQSICQRKHTTSVIRVKDPRLYMFPGIGLGGIQSLRDQKHLLVPFKPLSSKM